MFVNLTCYVASEQEHCIQNYQVYCLLKRALHAESRTVVKFGAQILHNFLYFSRKTVQDINDFGIASKLVQLLKQNSDDGFHYVSELLSALSKYILVIDPLSEEHLMTTFLHQEGL